MNGLSSAISKACCPAYNFGISNKINYGTNNKFDLIPSRLSNLHLQRIGPFEATKPMLKHRVYSAFKDVTGSRYEVPEVTSAVVPAIVMALGKAWEVVVQLFSARGIKQGAFILLGLSAVFLARGLLLDILCGLVVLRGQPFSAGDIIQVGYLKGEVRRTGVTTTSLLTDGNRLISTVPTSWFYGQVIKNESRTTTAVPYSLVFGKAIVNKHRTPWLPMVYKIYMDLEDLPKVQEISEEIKKMMRSNPNVHLEEQEPYCSLSSGDKYCELDLGCYFKHMNEEEYIKAKHNVILQACLIIKKHGALVGGYKGEQVKS